MKSISDMNRMIGVSRSVTYTEISGILLIGCVRIWSSHILLSILEEIKSMEYMVKSIMSIGWGMVVVSQQRLDTIFFLPVPPTWNRCSPNMYLNHCDIN